MSNFFDNFDYSHERWFEITSDDIMDLKPDVIVMSASSRVSDYVWGRQKNNRDIRKNSKKNMWNLNLQKTREHITITIW